MVNFKLVVSDKRGKSISYELKDKDAQPFLGGKIGNSYDSNIVGLVGGKLKVTGGSDKSGTPMRSDVHGGVKKYVLLSKGVGMNDSSEGKRIRKLVRGNMITEDIYQLNCILEDIDLQQPATSNVDNESLNSVQE
ncbi:MAG: S6e family ribosomal protein [Nitrososphaeraceae archaeon]